ncbi:MAG: MATE family efflux transporter [Proteobacteria bacterium]|nr:MATE family efflux transporter [Pseudomonadota bacterium]
MLANITTPLLGVVATTVIGRLGDAAVLGGVAMASLVFDCIFWLFGFLRSGTVALTAQAFGARDYGEQRAVLARAMMTAALSGLALIALREPLTSFVFDLMGGSGEVSAVARNYFLLRSWASPFALGNYVMLGWFIGLARPMQALAVQISVNVINMALTMLLVLVAGWGASGAAIAAVIAEICGLVLGLAMAWRMLDGRFEWHSKAHYSREKLWRMLLINRDIMLRTAALVSVFLFFSAQGARAGDVTLAANAVLQNIVFLGTFFLEGLANAAQQLCGASYGARDRDAFARAVRLIGRWGIAFGICAAVLFYAAGPRIIALMTSSEDVRRAANDFLLMAALVPLIGVPAFILDGVYVGATWTRDMRNLMAASLAVYLAAWWALQTLGNTGLWLALLIFYVLRGGLQVLRYPGLARKPWPER